MVNIYIVILKLLDTFTYTSNFSSQKQLGISKTSFKSTFVYVQRRALEIVVLHAVAFGSK